MSLNDGGIICSQGTFALPVIFNSEQCLIHFVANIAVGYTEL